MGFKRGRHETPIAGFALLLLAVAWTRPAAAQLGAGDERVALKRNEPARIVAQGRPVPGERLVMRLRFYADDDDYRAGAPQWQERLRRNVDLINEVVAPVLPVRFEIESLRRWPRKASPSQLEPVLTELERHDDGHDVDWVIGLTAPLALVTAAIHDLGTARILGRHFVMRAMASVEEMAEFRRAFPVLARTSPGDLSELFSRRRQHREMVVFLHEWAHTLGGIHVGDPGRILCPTLSNRSSLLGPMDVALLQAALQDRMEAGAKPPAAWPHLRAFIANQNATDWYEGERERLATALDGGAAGAARAPALATDPGAAPAEGEAAPAPGTPDPALSALIASVEAKLARGERDQALAEVQAVAEGNEPRPWVTIAGLYRLLGALSWAEDALGKAPPGPPVDREKAFVLLARRRWGLPPSGPGAVPAEQQMAYVDAVTGIASELGKSRPAKARALLQKAQQQYPNAPGLRTLACELAINDSRAPAASKHCNAAIAAMEDQPRAHYLLAHIKVFSYATEAAIKSLRRAVELDREQRDYWNFLGQLYRGVGRSKEFQALMSEQPPQQP